VAVVALIASCSSRLATTAGGLSSAAARASRSISDFRGSRTVKRGIRGRVAVAVGAGIDGAALGPLQLSGSDQAGFPQAAARAATASCQARGSIGSGSLQLLQTTGDQGTSQAGAGCSDPVGLGLQLADC
jgi:hypothetical protein